MRLSESDYQALMAKRGQGRSAAAADGGEAVPRAVARNEEPPRRMNKTEARYQSEILELMKRAGIIREFHFESVNFRLGENVHYRPDFMVIMADGGIEYHEVKGGYIREDAMIKFKTAARMYPYFRWQMHQWAEGEWKLKLEL